MATTNLLHRPLFLLMEVAILVLATAAVSGVGAQAGAIGRPPPECTRNCGGIDVPYPFGIEDAGGGADCYNPSVGNALACNHSYNPPKLLNGNVEVTGINISSAEMEILLNISYDCYTNGSGDKIGHTWETTFGWAFRLSDTANVFMAVGCDTLAQFRVGNRSFAGCMSGCDSPARAVEGECSGFGCCETPIPPNIGWYWTTNYLRDNTSEAYKFNPCSYFFVAKKGNYTFRRPDLEGMDEKKLFPVALDWAIGRMENLSCPEAEKNTSSYACVSSNSKCSNSSNGPGYTCSCSKGYQGNPYLADPGCTDIDECKKPDVYPCKGICENTAGSYSCSCPKGHHSDDPFTEKCTRRAALALGWKLTIGIGSGVALVFILTLLCCLGIQRRNLVRLREKCFERNGGTFLQQAIASNRSTFKIFSLADLEKATDSFSKEQILGQGGFGTVFRGRLDDGRIVAIKRSLVIDEKNGKEFANELFILSEINHRNIVKLVGCCLDDEVPMLVYEFIARGTLFGFIHSEHRLPISFSTRVRMAIEAAEALKYLHMDASPPILHGDVKSSNVLLDENYLAKVSDFGTSSLAPKDKAQFTTFIQGTYGYLDPEYMINGCLTDKSDVFSFGVILTELLTRRKPFDFEAKTDKERSLALSFISCASSNRLEEVLDPEIVEEGVSNEVLKVAKVALQCLNVKGEERPTMKEVVAELESANGAQRHPWNQNNMQVAVEEEHLLGGAAASVHGTTTATISRLLGSGGTGGDVQDTGTINHGFFGIESGR